MRDDQAAAYCHANAKGQVLVTYQAASKAGAGSDTLTAALDPFGTGEATDQYTYATSSTAKITGLRWDPSPIAAAGTLAPGDKVTIHLAALAAGGAPVPSASVQIALTQAAGSDATVSAKGCTGNDTGLLRCQTDSTGHVTLTYTSARNLHPGGSDTLQATTSPSPGSATATDTYAYAKIGSLVWSTDPVTEAGTLGAGQKVPLTVTARNGTKPVTGAMVYLSLTRADVTPGVPDNATARCGTTALPAYCRTNAHGQVQVTYQTATTPGTGSDTLTAALDPFGTGQATDQYTYAAASASKITGLSLDPSPIAPAGTGRRSQDDRQHGRASRTWPPSPVRQRSGRVHAGPAATPPSAERAAPAAAPTCAARPTAPATSPSPTSVREVSLAAAVTPSRSRLPRPSLDPPPPWPRIAICPGCLSRQEEPGERELRSPGWHRSAAN